MNWDDLKIVRAVFRAGSFALAAKQLGVNETTVSRRLARFEKALGMTMFNAIDGERRPTAYCREVVAIADAMATQAEGLDDLVQNKRPAIVRRRIAATDSVSIALLAPDAARFMEANPGVGIDILASTANVEFSRWEADVAIRLRRPDKGNFTMRKLADLSLFLVEPLQYDPDLFVPVCAYTEDLSHTPEMRYLDELGILEYATCRSRNLIVLKTIIRSGRYRGVLPGFMCSDLADDAALVLTRLPVKRSAWLLIQSHLKSDSATRSVVDWISERFASSI